MRNRLWLPIALLAVGAALLVAASLPPPSEAASGATGKTGGTLNYELNTDVDYTDPALAYYVPSWEIEYATCLKLLNYPDANGPRGSQLQAEAAAFPRISNGGRTYDFAVEAGFTKFSNGQPVTAKSFQHAIERLADPKMQSGAAPFIADIVGAQAKLDGKASRVSGVKVKGSHLVVTLTRPAPDFLSRIAMPFFCAVPTNLPVDPNGVLAPAAAGPYYIASRVPNRSIVLKRNPYYKGKRPRNVAQVNITIGNSLDAIYLKIRNGQADLGDIPTAQFASLANQYGVNKGRFFVKPAMGVWYLAMNHDRPLFKRGGKHGNVDLKKAINYALDRHALVIQRGAFSGVRTDQVLPPGIAGFKPASIYPTVKQPNFAFAKKLAKGNTGSGKATLYTFSNSYGPLWAQIVQFDLKQIGLDVEVRQFARAVQFEKDGTRGEPFDLTLEGWNADYPDPYDFINVLLSGDSIHAAHNNNVSYFDDPVFDARMKAAARLTGAKRSAAYGQLDVDIMKQAAPLAPILNPNNRYFVSERVGCFTYNNVYGRDFGAICLKK